MKNIRLSLVLGLFSLLAMQAQESVELFSVPLSDSNAPGKLVVEQIAGSIDVIGYNGKEVIVKASFGNRKAFYDDADVKDGLKRIKNTSLKIQAEEKNNVVQIINEQFNRVTNLEVRVPYNFSLKLSTVNKGNITVEKVKGDFEISNVNGEITLKEISGSTSTDTVNGDIKIDFEEVTQNSSMAFSSLNGDIDISFPKTLKANVKAKSDMGDIFTDFEMVVAKQNPKVETDTSSKTYKVKIEQWVQGKINGGGPEMIFKTFNGDILIRSK